MTKLFLFQIWKKRKIWKRWEKCCREFNWWESINYQVNKRHSPLSKPHSPLKNTLFASELVEISINSTERTPILNSKIHPHNNTHSVPLNSTCLIIYLTLTEMWKFKFQFCSDACCLLVARRWTSFNSFTVFACISNADSKLNKRLIL